MQNCSDSYQKINFSPPNYFRTFEKEHHLEEKVSTDVSAYIFCFLLCGFFASITNSPVIFFHDSMDLDVNRCVSMTNINMLQYELFWYFLWEGFTALIASAQKVHVRSSKERKLRQLLQGSHVFYNQELLLLLLSLMSLHR